VLAATTAIAVGLWPALRRTGDKLAAVLQHGRRGGAGSQGASRTRQVLVVAELALALTLLVAAGLVLQSLKRLIDVDPGFRSERLITMRLSLPLRTYPDSMQAPFYRELLTRLAARPGIEAVAAANTPPIATGGVVTGVRPLGRADGASVAVMNPVTAITPGYFATIGVPVGSGRDIAWADAKPTIVVTESAARRFWPGESPLGKHLAFGKVDTVGVEVVGVVPATRARGLNVEATPMIYLALPAATSVVRSMSLLVRGRGDSAALAATTRSVLNEIDRNVPVFNVQSVQQILDQSVAQPRLNTSLLTVFAVMALVLAAIGIYGVISFSVTQRTQEIGVRMALGAQRSQVFQMVLREGAVLVGVGTVVGLGCAFIATPLIRSWLFGITPTDPLTLAGTTAILAILALAASYIPARRATRVDPVVAMRAD
jgi:predicted permease